MFLKGFLLQLCLSALVHYARSQATVEIVGAGTLRDVSESIGSTQVCVRMRNGSPGDSAQFQLRTIPSTAVAGVDFVSLIVNKNVNNSSPQTCANIEILQNGLETGTSPRRFSVSITGLAVTGNVDISTDTLQIAINDTDRISVAFSESQYQVMEGMMVQVCVMLVSGSIATGVNVDISYMINQSSSTDIQLVNQDFVLTDSSTTSCIGFTASTNGFIESNRYHSIHLEIDVIPVIFTLSWAQILVIDSNAAVLSIDGMTMRSIIERNFSMNTIETICLDLVNVGDGLRRPIVVNIATVNETATSGSMDFVALMTNLTIPEGSSPTTFMSSDYCVNVTINGDDLRELNETFAVVFDASPDRFQGPSNVTITILQDGDVNDCTTLLDPDNGMVIQNGTSLGSVAQYSCISNRFRLVPESSRQRTCGMNNWNGQEPRCVAVCDPLEIQNGQVTIPAALMFIEAGTVAFYICNMNYSIVGNMNRTCGNDGLWSGLVPVCQVIDCGRLDNPENGGVVHSGTTVGAVATYNCNKGYTLMGGGAGGNRRVCATNGNWTGSAPICSGAAYLLDNQSKLLIAVAAVISTIFYTKFSL